MVSWESLSNSFWFAVSAYVAAFLPWTALAHSDFLNAKWTSVRRTRKLGYRNLIWTFVPMSHVIFYGVVQWKGGEYAEMAAAGIATMLAFAIGLRTIWGLWQLYEFHSWARKSIDALGAIGIEYSLPCLEGKQRKKHESTNSEMSSKDIADEILVNEKIVDNQIFHGEVQCFLQFGEQKLLNNENEFPVGKFCEGWMPKVCDVMGAMLEPFKLTALWMYFILAMILECIRCMICRRKVPILKQVPKDPVNVWVHWAAAFASQGLQTWISEFQVTLDPNAPEYGDMKWKSAKQKFHERGKYFGSQLLVSATLQLWSEYNGGLVDSPFLWDEWKEKSEMNDGRFLKQELFRDALEKGQCLPFGAIQLHKMSNIEDKRGECHYTYNAYGEVLQEFISELPVRSSFVREMASFDVQKLEWLTIVLHMGSIARKIDISRMNRMELDTGDQFCSTGSVDSSGSPNSSGAGYKSCVTDKSSNIKPIIRNGRFEADRREPNGEEIEAINVLLHQVGFVNDLHESQYRKESRARFESTMQVFGMSLMREAVVSDGNRLVCKTGEVMDVWLGLMYGDHIGALKGLNDEWDNNCLGENCEDKKWGLRDIHRELEKRRLERRIACRRGGRYEYLDGYVTFMGYRMEAVRTVLGRYVQSFDDDVESESDLFHDMRKEAMENESIELQLSEMMSRVLEKSRPVEMLRRRGVVCRLIWELQNELEKSVMRVGEWRNTNMKKKMKVATIMLMLLSFPGLRTEFGENPRDSEINEVEQDGERCSIHFRCWSGNEAESGDVGEESRGLGGTPLVIRVMCGAQAMRIEAVVGDTGKCTLKIVNDGGGRFRWEWWRDAFLGRMEGFNEWQESVGIPGVALERVKISSDEGAMSEVKIDTRTVSIWTWWPPFRVGFCRLELEGKEALWELKEEGRNNAAAIEGNGAQESPRFFSEVPVLVPFHEEREVKYDDAEESVLRDSRVLVEQALRRLASGSHDENSVRGATNAENGNNQEELMTVRNNGDSSRRVMNQEGDETRFGDDIGMRHSLEEFICSRPGAERVRETVKGLYSFLGRLRHEREAEVEAEVEYVVLPACEKLIEICADAEVDLVERIVQVLCTCLVAGAGQSQKVMTLMQKCIMFANRRESRILYMMGIAHCLLLNNRQLGSEPSHGVGMYVPPFDKEGLVKENDNAAAGILAVMREDAKHVVTSNRKRERILEGIRCGKRERILEWIQCLRNALSQEGAHGVASDATSSTEVRGGHL